MPKPRARSHATIVFPGRQHPRADRLRDGERFSDICSRRSETPRGGRVTLLQESQRRVKSAVVYRARKKRNGFLEAHGMPVLYEPCERSVGHGEFHVGARGGLRCVERGKT